MSISPEMLKQYKATAQERAQAREEVRIARYRRAWQLAREAATLLREQFGATRVRVFGSLTHIDRFTAWSDVDLAVWGLEGTDYFAAVAKMQDLDQDIGIDLVAVPHCSPSLLKQILEEGKDL
jgi:predicted nucleotidyltransferase